ncbi:MAG: hypothetical protein WC775_05625 [Patescibacteria group bacterium]
MTVAELLDLKAVDHELVGCCDFTVQHALRPSHKGTGTPPGILRTALSLTEGLPTVICELTMKGNIPMLDVVPFQRMHVAKGYHVMDQGGTIRPEHILYITTQVNGSWARIPITMVLPGGFMQPRRATLPFPIEFGPYTLEPHMNPTQLFAYMKQSVRFFDAMVKAKGLFK